MIKQFPVLKSEGLMLRRLTEDDIQDLFEMRSDPRMIEYTDSCLDENLAETRKYMATMDEGFDKGQWILWVIELRETGKVIGSISVWNLDSARNSAELGYGIIPKYQHRGHMKEALRLVIEYAFEHLDLELVEAYTEEKHLSSRKLLEGTGFKERGRIDDAGHNSPRVFHMVIYERKKQS